MRMRDRNLYRDYNLYLNGNIIGEFTTKDKLFEGVNLRSDAPVEAKKLTVAEFEELALNG